MMEYFVLSRGESKGITPGQLLDVTPRPLLGITPILLQGFAPALYKELLSVDQDLVMAGGNGNRGQGNEGLTRLTATVTEDTIPTASPKFSPSFAMLYEDVQSVIENQSQSEQKWLCLWDEFEQKEACQWKVYESRVAQKKAMFKDDQATKKASFQIDQGEKQKRFQCEHLSQEIRFESEQWK